jgi:ATP-dependent Clp protease ATP-binding subunit ClpC
MNISDKFSKSAREALSRAQIEAREMGYNYVGTEILLLGILSVEGSPASETLKEYNVDAASVRENITRLVGKGDFEFDENFGYTTRTRNIIELSLREAGALKHDQVTAEHLLLALLRETGSVAARILMDMGVNLGELREKLVAILKDPQSGVQTDVRGGKTPKLDKFGRDLTQMARDGVLDPVIGRAREIERVVQILSRRTKNNPVLIGEPGVGKTAIAEGLAQQIVNNTIPDILKGKRVVALDLSGMLAGTKYRGEFEERLKGAMEEIRKNGDIILFIDELHTIIGAGAAEGAIDAANILKPALARGEIQAVGATTLDEYRKHIEKDAALERRFQPVMVDEPTIQESIEILNGLRERYESHHKVRITDEAIRAAVELSDRYISDRKLPDKAIDLIDEAGSRVHIRNYVAPPDMDVLEGKLAELQKTKEEAVGSQDFEKAARIRDEEKKIRAQMEEKKKAWDREQQMRNTVVDTEAIAEIVSSWVSIPVTQLTQDESERLMHMEETLHKRVIGQDDAVRAVSRSIRRARAGLKDPRRPIGSFIFLGPTGVGKTELTKALAETLFGNEDAMIRLDMSEYMERHSVSKLVGSPPGYVGYEEGGQLTERVRRRPYSVVLLDEIEKAHPDVFNMLLQILEDGRLTDSQGRTVDFRNTVIIMTSNVGAMRYGKMKAIGFSSGGEDRIVCDYDKMKESILDELKNTFRPEFLNRIDEIIVFHALEPEHTRQIVDLMLERVIERLTKQGIRVQITSAAREFLSREGFDPVYGARPLRRAIQRMIEDSLSEEILSGRLDIGDAVLIDEQEGKLVFKKSEERQPV